uniref:TSA: Wollemia nobilis Ref_Wollemi_Transcript_7794_1699 transcribed RNA sequence n=1 Tax=Wollemia nobilis TaxID=56998 RepID=A0A0C9QUX6_9CONI
METSVMDIARELVMLIILLLPCWFLLFKRIKKDPRSLPPGPPYWWLVGNIFHLKFFSRNNSFQCVMHKLEATYGPIFTLRSGSTPFIVVMGAQETREGLVEKGHVFDRRPPSAGPTTIGSTPHGPLWRTLRKNLATEIFQPVRLKAFRPGRERAVEGLVDRLRQEAAKNAGAVVKLSENIRVTVFGILIYMCFGVEMDVGKLWDFQEVMAAMLERSRLLALDYHACPLLDFFQSEKEGNEIFAQGGGLFVRLVQKRRRMLAEGTANGTAYVDTLMALQLSEAELLGLCAEFVHAGLHSTSLTIQFAVAILMKHPHVQDKLYEEVKNADAEGESLAKMAYLNAVVMETLRTHMPGYFTLPYAVTRSCTLAGYDIPEKAVVYFYLESMTKDARLWKEPSDFVPERFLGAEVDVTGTKEMKMIPFGSGRRMCPGFGVGMLHLRLIVTRLVQAFEWKCLEGETVDLSERNGFQKVMAKPLRSLGSPLKALIEERP